MKDILHDEDQLELLNDILVCVKGRTVRQIYMRIMNEFPDTNLSFPKLESVYTVGMTAPELLKALYPDCVSEPVTPPEVEEATIDPVSYLNMLAAGEMDYEDRCTRFITEVRYGNAGAINADTLKSLAVFLGRHSIFIPSNLEGEQEIIRMAEYLFQRFCDDEGQWLETKAGRPKESRTSADIQRDVDIVADYFDMEEKGIIGEKRIKLLIQRYGGSATEIKQMLSDYKKRQELSDARSKYDAGKCSWEQFSNVVYKNCKVKEIKLKSDLKK